MLEIIILGTVLAKGRGNNLHHASTKGAQFLPLECS